jgi:regulation of enolase protein 1 (concanavalin A-like superfamily)
MRSRVAAQPHWVTACLLLACATAAHAQTSTTPGQLITYSTLHSIGMEWDIAHDTDHDARADVEYRPASNGEWKPAMPLVRIDGNGRNMLAGSVLFLTPGTEYVVRVTLLDPDGGGDSREVTVATRPLPVAPAGGRVFHVVPGSGGGDGSASSPFRGVAAAQAVAAAGDTFLLHGGYYGGRIVFSRPGTAGNYIAWKAAGDGEVTMAGIDIVAGHLWLEGLTVRDQHYGTRTEHAPQNVVLTRSFFYNNHYSIFLSGGGGGWYIADNVIVGNTPVTSGSDEGEGIELLTTNGHTVAYNRITSVADGISYPRTNVDIFGNDIFDTADDGIELDFGLANVRVWGNRIHNAYHNGISFQPQSGGPWYLIRNQIVGSAEAPLKFRTTDRFVLLHNTIVNWGGWMFCCQPNDLLKAYARNNLWISAQGGQMWSVESKARDWRTNLDYDGFDWGTGAYPFWFDGNVYYDVHSFAAASGLVPNGIRVFKDSCFQDFRVPGPPPAAVPPHVMSLQPSCNAVDAGAVLPNVNDGFSGTAPDLGAHEHGHALARYGPRAASSGPSVTLTSPASGTSYAATATIALAAAAADDVAVARVEFFAGATRIGSDASAPYAMTWSGVAAGTYRLTARATDNEGHVATSAEVTITVVSSPAPAPAPAVLPAGWAHRDVGAVSAAGTASENGGAWSLTGSGADVWGRADEFHFAYRELSGDGSIVARVTWVQDTHAWAKAGVMMRASLEPGAAHAFMFATPGANGLAFQRRVAAGGSTTHTGSTGGAPVWLRLTRRGGTITASHSADGSSWTAAGSETIPMSSTIFVGLALTSHADGVTGTAAFDAVAVSSSAAAALPPGWAHRDIGAVGVAGGAAAAGGVWTLTAAGADIWGTRDAFHFAYRALTGDGAIVARVSGLTAGDVWAKAGVMVRGTLDAAAPHAFMLVTPQTGGHGLAFQRRTSAGGTTTHTGGGAGSAPVWVKLQRIGSRVIASRSSDGAAWTTIGEETLALGATVYAGVALTSHDASATASATVDNVAVEEGSATWAHGDIGSVAAAGDAWLEGDRAVVAGSGADIWGTSDAFHFAYRAVRGNFTITARVSRVDAVDAWTKAGLMIRASTQPGSAHASVFATPSADNGVAFQRRRLAGGASTHTAGPAVAPAVWLRLSRRDGVVTAAYRLSDSDPWVAFGAEWLEGLPDDALVGLAVTSHADGDVASASFDGVSVSAGP